MHALDAPHGFIGFDVEQRSLDAPDGAPWRRLHGPVNGGFAFKQAVTRIIEVPPDSGSMTAYRFGFRRNRGAVRFHLVVDVEPRDDIGMRRELLELVPRGKRFDAVELIHTAMHSGFKVSSFPLLDYWIDIGQMEDFHKAQEDIQFLDL